jgi:transcriptional regulator with XRE-family HTH domain
VNAAFFARAFRALRVKRRLTQEELGAKAGMSRGVVARIEQGHADRVTIATLEALAAELGARFVARLSWNGEALDRLLDAAHASIVEGVIEVLHRYGWQASPEVSFSEYGERGSIDVLAFHPARRILLVVEVKSVIPDVQAMLMAIDRKARLAPRIARGRGWDATTVGTLLVVAENRTARRRVGTDAATFGAALPKRGREVHRWLRSRDDARPLRGLWLLSNESHAVARQRVRRAANVAKREDRPIR